MLIVPTIQLLLLSLFTLTLALPQPQPQPLPGSNPPAIIPKARLDIPPPPPPPLAASAGDNDKNVPVGGEDKSVNYLVTLSRTVTNIDKDAILDLLMQSGAVVKQVYDYRVYKGVLFSVPTTSDLGLASWAAKLDRLSGVKGVEVDVVVKTS